MAEWHLNELRAALERRAWRIAEHPGDRYGISATWEIARSGQSSNLFLDFNGLDDLQTLPLDQAYACTVRDNRVELYFSRRGETGSPQRSKWKDDLKKFLAALDQLN